ncbi:MAG: hypothetical protein EOP73_29195 [Variovorax sp.]|nr:MAG: hypothetical protein EOP73_29195 [Variovorax sp.]
MLFAQRRARDDAAGEDADLFGDIAWDIMLVLFIANEEDRDVDCATMSALARMLPQTVERWLTVLESRGLLNRPIDDANANALRAALQAADGPVLVHCASGNRVGGLLALMQARSGEMTTEQALEFGRSAGMTGTEARVRELLDAGD